MKMNKTSELLKKWKEKEAKKKKFDEWEYQKIRGVAEAAIRMLTPKDDGLRAICEETIYILIDKLTCIKKNKGWIHSWNNIPAIKKDLNRQIRILARMKNNIQSNNIRIQNIHNSTTKQSFE